MFRGFITLLLLLAATAATAADAPNLYSNAVAHSTDLSVTYLAMIFGHVGNVLHGTSGQMFGHLMSSFNKGVMVIAAVILGYNVIFTIMRFTTEGTLMSQNRNTFLILFRIGFGFALLIPSPETGYNLIQTTLISVVKHSVSFGDMIWSGVLDHLDKGDVLWHPPATQKSINSGTDSSSIFNKNFLQNTLSGGKLNTGITPIPVKIKNLPAPSSGNSNANYAMMESIFMHSVCVYNNRFYSSQHYLVPMMDTKNQLIDFPSYDVSRKKEIDDGCGTINYGAIAGMLGSKDAASQLEIGNQLFSVVQSFNSAASGYVCANNDKARGSSYCYTPSGDSDLIPMWQNNLASTMQGGYLTVASMVRQAVSEANNDQNSAKTQLIQRMRQEGWIMAGAYYWAMSSFQSSVNTALDYGSYNLSLAKYISAVSGDNFHYSNPAKLSNLENTSRVSSIVAWDLLKNSAAASGKGATSKATYDPLSAFSGIVKTLLGPFAGVITDVINLTGQFASSSGSSPFGIHADPILWLSGLGQTCMSLAADLFFAALLTTFSVAMITAGLQCDWNFWDPLREGFSWLKPVIISSSALFIGLGVMLSFMVPLYPFLIFVFGVIGWFIMVIEAVVAMPLVALGITHPEGHDLLGKAEQALMLALGVFLRPALMVMGLIASMILSYVGLRFLIWSYSVFLTDLFSPTSTTMFSSGGILTSAGAATAQYLTHSTSPWGMVLRALIALPLLLFIFAAMAYQMVIACYSLVYSLPDFILRWIGGPQQPSMVNPAEVVQGMSSQIQGGVGQMGQLVTQAGSNKLREKPKKGSLKGEYK
jgi:defect in organelle trafficking protein DotA